MELADTALVTVSQDLPAIRGVVNTLVQTEKYGTPLAHSLRVLASEFREQRLLKAEPARATEVGRRRFETVW